MYRKLGHEPFFLNFYDKKQNYLFFTDLILILVPTGNKEIRSISNLFDKLFSKAAPP